MQLKYKLESEMQKKKQTDGYVKRKKILERIKKGIGEN